MIPSFPPPLPASFPPSHDAVSLPLSRVCCIVAAVQGEGSSRCMVKVAGKQIFSVALAQFGLGHVAPGLDLLHQHGRGETCRWTCMQVSCKMKFVFVCFSKQE